MIVVECDELCIDYCLCTGYVDKKVNMFDEVLVMIVDIDCLIFVGLLGNVVDIFFELVKCNIIFDVVID